MPTYTEKFTTINQIAFEILCFYEYEGKFLNQ